MDNRCVVQYYTTGAGQRFVDLTQERFSNVVPLRREQRSDAVRNYHERSGCRGWGSDNVLTTLGEGLVDVDGSVNISLDG
ncbi:hypothetical protein PGTUg99_036021 [Puccinia graminis f. sp. tritici]|uniref:Uncharacterized protein n=1 Tax=Puccinia graminis f. sp. tritici TaxID=56615 RepID=A0A5B0QUZ3_PUCGR|nr:hypothetical protein PGTUg99_036021 [Puccinia graminis f. sp. tritici]